MLHYSILVVVLLGLVFSDSGSKVTSTSGIINGSDRSSRVSISGSASRVSTSTCGSDLIVIT